MGAPTAPESPEGRPNVVISRSNRRVWTPIGSNRMAGRTTEFRGRVYDSIVETIGATPLVRIHRLVRGADAKADIRAKCEFFNGFGQRSYRCLDDSCGRG